MDPRTFDGIVQRLAGSRTRRSVLAGSLFAVLGAGEATLARQRHKDHAHSDKRHRARQTAPVSAQSRLNINELCPKKKHGKKLTCEDCRTGFSLPYTNAKGKTVQKCACKPVGEACSAGTAANCCSGVCSEDGQCISPLSPGQTCSAVGINCAANAQCCNATCNLGGSDTGPLPGYSNKCAACLTGGATCDPNDDRCCFGGCSDVDAGPGVTGQCCSQVEETCTPTGSSATEPAQGTCCNDRNRCPATGGVGAPNVCCTASGFFPPRGSCGGANTGQGCCTGQCNSGPNRCCAPAGTNPALSGGTACAGAEANISCCSGTCAAAGICA